MLLICVDLYSHSIYISIYVQCLYVQCPSEQYLYTNLVPTHLDENKHGVPENHIFYCEITGSMRSGCLFSPSIHPCLALYLSPKACPFAYSNLFKPIHLAYSCFSYPSVLCPPTSFHCVYPLVFTRYFLLRGETLLLKHMLHMLCNESEISVSRNTAIHRSDSASQLRQRAGNASHYLHRI